MANWTYPKDTPSNAMAQHPKPRKSWAGRIVLGASIVAALVAASSAWADQRVIDGMGGGSFSWAFPIVLRVVEDREPVRLEGRFTSAGTFLLYAVEQLPGSCVAPDAFFAFHEPQQPASALIGCAPFPLSHP